MLLHSNSIHPHSPDWPHRRQCLRVTFSQDPQIVREGLEIIAEVVAEL